MRSNNIDTSYAARFIPSKDRISEHPRREHCSASENQLRMIGINPGQQVRIERPTENGTRFALYTIDAHANEEEDPEHTVFVGYTDPNLKDLQERLGWSSKDSFKGKINTQVTAVGLSDAEAKGYSEFIEQVNDDGFNQELAVIAPHGGDVEEGTAQEAERIIEQLSSKCVSAWICKGYRKGGEAYACWHITSTDISEDSFPGLQMIMNRQFRYVIAFHGWKKQNLICIGGSMSDPLKQQIKTEIAKVVPSKIVVDIAGPGSNCPDDYDGNDPRNIVNRLGTYGVQIEQSKEAREKYGDAIADAVANVFRPLIKEGGFLSPNNVIVTEQDLRDAIGSGAQTERDNWRDTNSNLLMEDENSQFGLLVKYWLASKGRISPTTLTAAQTKAISPDTSYGKLLNKDATEAEIAAEAATVRATLLTGAPDIVSPSDLRTLVEQSLISSRFSRLNDDDRGGRWSAAFVAAVVRNAAIRLGPEVMSGSTHIGRDGLLVGTSAHRIYVLEAYNRRFGTDRRTGTYHAFRPEERRPKIGDIIIQDRVQSDSTSNVVQFDDIPTTLNSGYNLHGDVVVEVPNGADHIIAIGGNVGNSTRRRRYPLDLNRRLVVDRTQLYTQESDSGNLPTLPETDDTPGLHTRSTGRIFALLSLVQQCSAVLGQ